MVQSPARRPIPVILDSDVGSDIDDMWALAFLLKSPELDLKLVVTATADTTLRAKFFAKYLETVGRSEIPIGIGLNEVPQALRHEQWVRDYDLSKYQGIVHQDGVQAMIDVIMASPVPITVIAIAPVPNIAEALRRKPEIAAKVNFVGMQGSVFRGYGGGQARSAEWNVRADTKASQLVFAAPWRSMLITPLDTCGIVQLRGEKFAQIAHSTDKMTAIMMENYRVWDGWNPKQSSVLFDTVAVYLAFSQDLVKVQRLGLTVDDDGFTVPDEKGKQLNAAVEWRNLDGFYDLLVDRLK